MENNNNKFSPTLFFTKEELDSILPVLENANRNVSERRNWHNIPEAISLENMRKDLQWFKEQEEKQNNKEKEQSVKFERIHMDVNKLLWFTTVDPYKLLSQAHECGVDPKLLVWSMVQCVFYTINHTMLYDSSDTNKLHDYICLVETLVKGNTSNKEFEKECFLFPKCKGRFVNYQREYDISDNLVRAVKAIIFSEQNYCYLKLSRVIECLRDMISSTILAGIIKATIPYDLLLQSKK